MKGYEYNGNLQEDLKKLKKKFDIKRFLGFELVIIISVFVVSGGLGLIFGLERFIRGFLIVSLFLTLRNFIDIKKETKEDIEKTTEKLADLYTDINENSNKEFSKDLARTRMKECVSRVDSIQKINSYDMETLKKLKKEEKITTYFYLLDPKDQLQVLKQVRSIIINKKHECKSEELALYLLDEKDIKEENISIPVQKTIKLNTK